MYSNIQFYLQTGHKDIVYWIALTINNFPVFIPTVRNHVRTSIESEECPDIDGEQQDSFFSDWLEEGLYKQEEMDKAIDLVSLDLSEVRYIDQDED